MINNKLLVISSLMSALLMLFMAGQSEVQAVDYSLEFSTYLGGDDVEHIRDTAVDPLGNLIVAGGSRSANYPATITDLSSAACPVVGSEGNWDAVITKFSPAGNVIWSLKMGSKCYDRVYGLEVDSAGNIYIAGRAGEGFPVTTGAFQTNFQGTNQGIYGNQNAFVAKLDPNGHKLWASYAGTGNLARDIAVDSSGDIYIPMSYTGTGPTANPTWLINAYQKTTRGGYESGVMKIKGDGSQVYWATYLGGSGDDQQAMSVRVDGAKNVYVASQTTSTDFPTTSQAYDRTANGGYDFYTAKFSPDGSQLLYSTYIGGSGTESINTHNLALDAGGNAYISVFTDSVNYPVTTGAYQTTAKAGSNIGISKISPNGGLLASTFLESSAGDNSDGILVGKDGNIYLTGVTDGSDFPITQNAYQNTKGAGNDAIITILTPDLQTMVYSTFLGGAAYDNSRTIATDLLGNIYIAGGTDGVGWLVKNAYQMSFQGGIGSYGTGDAFVARLSANQISITLTPTIILTNTPIPSPTATPTSITTKPGDADGDGDADEMDFNIWKTYYNTSQTGASYGDFNGSGIVDGLDYMVWLNNY